MSDLAKQLRETTEEYLGLIKGELDPDNEIERRSNVGKDLATRYPELKGLSWEQFLEKLPVNLDFITASEMHKALSNPQP